MLFRNLLRSSGCRGATRWCARRLCSSTPLTPTEPPSAVPASAATSPADVITHTMPHMEAPMTTVCNPIDHTMDQIGLWYTVPPEECEQWLNAYQVTPYQYRNLREAFEESSIMIRRPALAVISYIKRLKLDTMPPPKFMFYGYDGAGKTMSIAHVTHFLMKDEFVVMQMPWMMRLLRPSMKYHPEVVVSASVPDRWDHTTDSSVWLKFFRSQNGETITKRQLTISKDYQLSTREGCAAGSSLFSLIDLGISRPRLAADCILAISQELRQLAMDGRCKVAMVMDGINGVFSELSSYKREDESQIHASQFTIVQAFTDMLKSDWHNGVVVGSVDNAAVKPADRGDSCLPIGVLGAQGFKILDPFVPVPVPEYSDVEFESAIAYLASKYWLQNPAAITTEGRLELATLTGRNALSLVMACNSM